MGLLQKVGRVCLLDIRTAKEVAGLHGENRVDAPGLCLLGSQGEHLRVHPCHGRCRSDRESDLRADRARRACGAGPPPPDLRRTLQATEQRLAETEARLSTVEEKLEFYEKLLANPERKPVPPGPAQN